MTWPRDLGPERHVVRPIPPLSPPHLMMDTEEDRPVCGLCKLGRPKRWLGRYRNRLWICQDCRTAWVTTPENTHSGKLVYVWKIWRSPGFPPSGAQRPVRRRR